MGIGDPRGIVAPQKGVGAADTAGGGWQTLSAGLARTQVPWVGSDQQDPSCWAEHESRHRQNLVTFLLQEM